MLHVYFTTRSWLSVSNSGLLLGRILFTVTTSFFNIFLSSILLPPSFRPWWSRLPICFSACIIFPFFTGAPCDDELVKGRTLSSVSLFDSSSVTVLSNGKTHNKERLPSPTRPLSISLHCKYRSWHETKGAAAWGSTWWYFRCDLIVGSLYRKPQV